MTRFHDHFTAVALEELVRSVVDDIVKAYQCNVDISYKLDNLSVSNDCATPWALLINEVVTNAIKYASAGEKRFTLSVEVVALDGGRARLSISDNGPGFDDQSAGNGMGRRLIKAVAAPLSGECHYEFADGTIFVADLDLGNVGGLQQTSDRQPTG